jgi:hypothetical protein
VTNYALNEGDIQKVELIYDKVSNANKDFFEYWLHETAQIVFCSLVFLRLSFRHGLIFWELYMDYGITQVNFFLQSLHSCPRILVLFQCL